MRFLPPLILGWRTIERTCRARAALRILLGVGGAWLGLRGAPWQLIEGEWLQPPSAARVRQVWQAADHPLAWTDVEPGLRDAALRAYAAGKLPVAQRWLQLAQWAALLGTTEQRCVVTWVEAVRAAKVGHPNMPREYSSRPVAIASLLPAELAARFLADADFTRRFFDALSPLDFAPQVLRLLAELHAAEPAWCSEYPALAIALALVYDMPPPPDWPHAQVGTDTLVRRWPSAREALVFFAREDKAGRTFQRLKRLEVEELKFVVDVAVPFAELTWSEQVVDVPLSHLDRVYSLVRYRQDRVRNQQALWPYRRYTLMEIMAQGGICVDQAFFACQAGKARGVPTLFFQGAGIDSRHAWFGYLDGGLHWRLDAGRYPEQKFVTGFTRDPQTWERLSDHQLAFLRERFFTLPGYQLSRGHARFARAYLAAGQPDAGLRAARLAVTAERRNLEAWEQLLLAQQAKAVPAKEREAALREALQAFGRYPDVETKFSQLLVQSLRGRGEKSAADFEENRLARKYRGERSDLSTQQAAQILSRSIAEKPLPDQLRTYQEVVEKYGRGAGIWFFDAVVAPFVEYLRAGGHKAEARRALERGRSMLKVETGSQLDMEIKRLEAGLK